MQASNALINMIPKGRPTHVSLDFERLRAEGIRHLENLATELWTDFNAHDPGITLLELLCYAITDLGYRTQMLPIEDIAAIDDNTKRWFDAHEILPMSPVTAYDLRKLLIDMEGVKNAWLERARPQDFRIKKSKGGVEYLGKNPPYQLKAFQNIFPKKQLEKDIAYLSKRFGAAAGKLFAEAMTQFGLLVKVFNEKEFEEQLETIDTFRTKFGDKITDFILCRYGYYKQIKTEKPEDALALNGVYRILIELEDHLDPASEKIRKRYARRALHRLHRERGLCQDYLEPEIVQNWCYCLCLDLETDPAANEKEVAADVLCRIRQFISPQIRSRDFREMRRLGLPCDQIFNGPLLDNGFILDADLQASPRLPRYIYRSDLLRIAAETPGVLDVRDLRLKGPGTAGKYSDEWQIKIIPDDYDPTKEPPGNLKPLLDACCSRITIHRNGLTQTLTGKTLEDEFNTRCMACQALTNSSPGRPEPPTGTYRDDLGDFVSLQYDLPAIYAVGQHLPRPAQEFPARQLQAYLLFYDQILAGYLAQLGQVSRLLAVEQDTAAPTMILNPLFDVPGAMDLMADFAEMPFPDDAIGAAETAALPDIAALEKKLADLQAALTDTTDAVRKAAIEARIEEVDQQLKQLKKMPALLEALSGKTCHGRSELRQALETALGPAFYAAYGLALETAVWQHFTRLDNNNLVQELTRIADPKARRQERRGRLLDHLIARFGESFSSYVATLTRADTDPEDNPWRQDFSEYLRDKARFLQSIQITGAERGRGFNYRLHNALGQPDVWNSDNVSGLQKRASRLLGLETWRSRSLLGTPPYRVELITRPNKQGAPVHFVQLERRTEVQHRHTNPLRPGPLMISKPFKSKALAEKFRLEVYQYIVQENILKIRPAKDEAGQFEVYFDYIFKNEKGEQVEHGLASACKPEESVDDLLNDLICLVEPRARQDHEGFHLIEHILLRPDDERDELLQLSLGCDPLETPREPYSFWLTVVLPMETGRFVYPDFREFVEQTIRREAPAHIALRFCWLTRDELLQFEPLFEAWLEAKALCTPDECHVTDAANDLICWLNDHTCTCACHPHEEEKSPCA